SRMKIKIFIHLNGILGARLLSQDEETHCQPPRERPPPSLALGPRLKVRCADLHRPLSVSVQPGQTQSNQETGGVPPQSWDFDSEFLRCAAPSSIIQLLTPYGLLALISTY